MSIKYGKDVTRPLVKMCGNTHFIKYLYTHAHTHTHTRVDRVVTHTHALIVSCRGYLVASCQGYRTGAALLLAPIPECSPQGLAQGQVYLHTCAATIERDGEKGRRRQYGVATLVGLTGDSMGWLQSVGSIKL